MDEKRLWMAKEISRWMQEGLIEEAKGNVLLQQYKKYGNTKVAIARMMGAAAFCFFLAGTALLITSFWAGLTQAGQFWWALAPLLLSFCLWASISLMKNHVEAFFRLKDGQGVITDILINGVSVKKSFTTFGDSAAVSYAGAEGSAYAEGQ